MSNRKVIEEYWENPNTVSLIDQNLRQMETQFVRSCLSANDDLFDVGCGAGDSTVHYAAAVKSCVALEQSATLRGKAAARFAAAGVTNVTLVAGDALDLSAYRNRFNVAVTQRVVINFMTWDEQKRVIENIRDTLRPGGRYIMIENTFEGFEAMNATRRAVGLPNVILHDWHNYFLHYDKLMEFLDGRFVVEKQHTFNLYYLLTRVFANMFASFDGFGAQATKDPIFEATDAAARKLHEVFGDRVTIALDKGQAFGPIQGFVLRKQS